MSSATLRLPDADRGVGPGIVVEELAVRVGRRGDISAVDGVSFRADAGQVTAVLGPNGAGKTTTVETIEGYREPSSGRVRVCGLDPRRDAKVLAPRIGVMLQRGGVYLTMGPREALQLFAAYYGTRAADPDGLIERLGLGRVAATPWRRLSGGEQQRLGLALALVGSPDVVLLDEPTAAVDASARTVISALIDELRGRGACVLLTTHDIDEAEKLADRVVILDRGRVVADGTPADLMRAGDEQTIRFGGPSGIDAAALSAEFGGAPVEERSRGEYVVGVAPNPRNVALLTSWLAARELPLADLRAGRQRLEDVFVRLTSESTDGGPPPERRARRRASGRAGMR